MGAAVLAGSAVLASCGGAPPTTSPNSGANQNCVPIDQRIAYDNAQINALQVQKSKTTNPGMIKQINNNITYWQQDAAYFKQQKKQFGCP
jgi:hypothetical protein